MSVAAVTNPKSLTVEKTAPIQEFKNGDLLTSEKLNSIIAKVNELDSR